MEFTRRELLGNGVLVVVGTWLGIKTSGGRKAKAEATLPEAIPDVVAEEPEPLEGPVDLGALEQWTPEEWLENGWLCPALISQPNRVVFIMVSGKTVRLQELANVVHGNIRFSCGQGAHRDVVTGHVNDGGLSDEGGEYSQLNWSMDNCTVRRVVR